MMAVLRDSYLKIRDSVTERGVTLVAVSKTRPAADIMELYDMGHRDFGENYVQELVDKQEKLPPGIRWHFIGHLQSNKVKYIAPFVHLIHGVDSYRLLQEINKQAARNGRTISCLLQLHVAMEETKFGMDEDELENLLRQIRESGELKQVSICGLMAMASFTENRDLIRAEFRKVKSIFDDLKARYFYEDDHFREISMGMSADYAIAVEEGATIIRVGSLIFGERH